MNNGDWVRTKDKKIMFQIKRVFEKIEVLHSYWAVDYRNVEYNQEDLELIYNPETFSQSNLKPRVEF